MEAGAGFLLLGDAVGLIALVTMLVAGETTEHPEPLRTALGTIHGLLVLGGCTYAMGTVEGVPEGWAVVLAAGSLPALGMVGVVVALAFPDRAPGESAWPMWRVTLGPLGYTAVWGAVAAWSFHRGWDGLADAARGSLAFLGIHDTLLTGGVLAALLARPPAIAPAADLTPRERLLSWWGRFLLTLVLVLWVQGGLAIATHHERVFGRGVWGPLVSGALWALGLLQGVRATRRVFMGS